MHACVKGNQNLALSDSFCQRYDCVHLNRTRVMFGWLVDEQPFKQQLKFRAVLLWRSAEHDSEHQIGGTVAGVHGGDGYRA